LFPVIYPSPDSSGSGRAQPAHPGHGRYRATAASDLLPLSMGELGSQVAGLIVLALGIIVAVARVSLRRPRGSPDKQQRTARPRP
jgi:hypothetical protein